MQPHNILSLGEKYSKKILSDLLNESSLITVREGVYSCKNSNAYLLFVDLEKQGKEERFHFDDFFEEDFFHWDSQTTQHIQSPKIKDIINGVREPHLFVRIFPKIKNKTQSFIYCGKLKYAQYEEGTSKPVHMVFHSIDYDDSTDNEDLLAIYSWHPEKAGKTTRSQINKKGVISEKRKKEYKKPDVTERRGLINSRVGQGYYRKKILEKWERKCPITDITLESILIASHIVPWSESNDDERLDVNNGILLSPNIDALFDKHLISFDEDGYIKISKKVKTEEYEILGISESMILPVTTEMIPYIKRHYQKFFNMEQDS